ncbi:hypothetical protein M5K25_015022 [Dendrobium thyrsiflorum]|uniref:Uncharacterized protein n=1 Tax=Dendrobium thyrsiflorum TaxID=117978 RepID=A0ABD0UPS6_DENTH
MLNDGAHPLMVLAGDAVLVRSCTLKEKEKEMEMEMGKGVIFWFLMNRREGNVYRRRGTLDERAMDPEQDATDGNTGEGRRELPAVAELSSSSLNATLETFTQMMATMTQMLKNIQTPAGGSGGGPASGSGGGSGLAGVSDRSCSYRICQELELVRS